MALPVFRFRLNKPHAEKDTTENRSMGVKYTTFYLMDDTVDFITIPPFPELHVIPAKAGIQIDLGITMEYRTFWWSSKFSVIDVCISHP